jgi:hypothetical protein
MKSDTRLNKSMAGEFPVFSVASTQMLVDSEDAAGRAALDD